MAIADYGEDDDKGWVMAVFAVVLFGLMCASPWILAWMGSA